MNNHQAAREIEAMRECWSAMAMLDEAGRRRVLKWLTDYSASVPDPIPQPPPAPPFTVTW